MQPERFVRLLPVSIFITAITGLALYMTGKNESSMGLMVGGIWSTLNLWVLYKLFQEVFFQNRPLPILLFAQLKLPVLYGLGYLALRYLKLDLLWAVVGFHIPVMVIVFVALAGVYKQPDGE